MASLRDRAGLAQTMTAGILALGMAATVGTAIGFEKIGGYIPCMLCLEQRTPYYIGVPLMLLALVLSWAKAPGVLVRLLLLAGGLLMLYGLGLGVYHSGVEWAWWAGPSGCSAVGGGTIDTGGKGILDAIDKVVPPSCDQAAGRFLGLSFAGWNVIASFLLAGIAFRGAFGHR